MHPVYVIDSIFKVAEFILILRVILSWIYPRRNQNEFSTLVYNITEPFIEPIRRFIPPIGGFDLSVLVAFFLLDIIRGVILGMFM